jgi:hypothetical protein
MMPMHKIKRRAPKRYIWIAYFHIMCASIDKLLYPYKQTIRRLLHVERTHLWLARRGRVFERLYREQTHFICVDDATQYYGQPAPAVSWTFSGTVGDLVRTNNIALPGTTQVLFDRRTVANEPFAERLSQQTGHLLHDETWLNEPQTSNDRCT